MNWHERIERAREDGEFTEGDSTLAASWVDCACGAQDPRIPRNANTNVPRDTKLAALGIDFYDCVDSNNITGAQTTLAQIERRAGEIVAEMDRD